PVCGEGVVECSDDQTAPEAISGAANRGSTLPPLMMMPTLFSLVPDPRKPASAVAPDGSTTIFSRSQQNDIASTIACSLTVSISETLSQTSGQVSTPREGVRSPSAIVGGLRTVCSFPE